MQILRPILSLSLSLSLPVLPSIHFSTDSLPCTHAARHFHHVNSISLSPSKHMSDFAQLFSTFPLIHSHGSIWIVTKSFTFFFKLSQDRLLNVDFTPLTHGTFKIRFTSSPSFCFCLFFFTLMLQAWVAWHTTALDFPAKLIVISFWLVVGDRQAITYTRTGWRVL